MNATIIKFDTLTNSIGATAQNNNFFLRRGNGFIGVQLLAHRDEIGQKYISEAISTNFYAMVFHQLLPNQAKLLPASGIAFAASFAAHFPVFLGTAGAKLQDIIAVGRIHIVNYIH